MKNLIVLLAVYSLSSLSFADVYSCSGSGYDVEIERIERAVVLPVNPPRHSSVIEMTIKGDRQLPSPARAQIVDGEIKFVMLAVLRMQYIDVTSNGGQFVSASRNERFYAYRVEGGQNLGNQDIADLYSIDTYEGTLHYVVDGNTSINCDLL